MGDLQHHGFCNAFCSEVVQILDCLVIASVVSIPVALAVAEHYKHRAFRAHRYYIFIHITMLLKSIGHCFTGSVAPCAAKLISDNRLLVASVIDDSVVMNRGIEYDGL